MHWVVKFVLSKRQSVKSSPPKADLDLREEGVVGRCGNEFHSRWDSSSLEDQFSTLTSMGGMVSFILRLLLASPTIFSDRGCHFFVPRELGSEIEPFTDLVLRSGRAFTALQYSPLIPPPSLFSFPYPLHRSLSPWHCKPVLPPTRGNRSLTSTVLI